HRPTRTASKQPWPCAALYRRRRAGRRMRENAGVEALKFDGPPGALEPVGKLAAEPDELTARLGLDFGPVEDGLGDAVLATARLGDGTLVAFTRLLNSPFP